ncbi:MAG: methyl-accepting chemotaxis protein [Spirochaetia bacterium]
MRNIRLVPKLLGGFLFVALLIVPVGYFGLTSVTRIAALLDSSVKGLLPGSVSILSLKVAMEEVEAAECLLLVAGIKDQDRTTAYSHLIDAEQSAGNALKAYEPLPRTDPEQALWAEFKPVWEDWWKEHETFVEMEKSYRAAPSEALHERMVEQVLGVEGAKREYALSVLSTCVELKNGYAFQAAQNGEDVIAQVRKATAVALVAGPLLAILVAVSFALSITRPLARGIALAELVAAGDLGQDIKVNRKDEVGKLARALNGMVERLRLMVARIQEEADLVASSTEEINSAIVHIAEGAQSQASSLDETSASAGHLAASVAQVAQAAHSQAAAVTQGSVTMARVQGAIESVSKNFDQIVELADQSMAKAAEGSQAVHQVTGGMRQIADSSEMIGGIVDVISDIADQTNLLALNASIEAARAGDHGRGFAVVADEVRKLAERSSKSTKEIERLMRTSKDSVARGVETASNSQLAMDHIRVSSQKVRETVSTVSASMAEQVLAVKELSQVLRNIGAMSKSISAATEQQTERATHVSSAVEDANQITHAAASSAQEISSAVGQLSELAQELQAIAGQFRVDNGPEAHVAEENEQGQAIDRAKSLELVASPEGSLVR